MSSSTLTSSRAWDLRARLSRTARVLASAAAISVAALAGAELVLRTLPISAGVVRADPQPGASSARHAPSREFTKSFGWDLRHVVHGRTNAQGFVAPFDYRYDEPAVALLGDSFAEGLMVAYPQSLPAQLSARVDGQRPVYNFGISASGLPHHLGIAREVGARYTLTEAVVVISDGDYEEGFGGDDGIYRWNGSDIAPTPLHDRSRLKKMLRESALLNYLRWNLKFDMRRMFAHSFDVPVCVAGALDAADHDRLRRFVDDLPAALRLPAADVVLVFDADRAAIYRSVDTGASMPQPCATRDRLALLELRRLAAAAGIGVLDMQASFTQHYRSQRTLLDFAPVDAHWNATAVEIVAREAARALR